jgi:hypothetical protein
MVKRLHPINVFPANLLHSHALLSQEIEELIYEKTTNSIRGKSLSQPFRYFWPLDRIVRSFGSFIVIHWLHGQQDESLELHAAVLENFAITSQLILLKAAPFLHLNQAQRNSRNRNSDVWPSVVSRPLSGHKRSFRPGTKRLGGATAKKLKKRPAKGQVMVEQVVQQERKRLGGEILVLPMRPPRQAAKQVIHPLSRIMLLRLDILADDRKVE